MGSKSIQKGKRGEREFSKYLVKQGINARRGQQYKGGSNSPDVISSLPYHIEVKRTEKLQLYPALEKAKDDGDGKIPFVAHRRNNKDWVIVMYADDFISEVMDNNDD